MSLKCTVDFLPSKLYWLFSKSSFTDRLSNMPTKFDNQILFLCTGNYYRSRFAQHLFNAWVKKNHGLNWQAESRGLAIERGFNNIGAISPHALKGLRERGVSVPANERFPLQVTDADVAIAEA